MAVFPQRYRDVVDPIAEAAIVEVDQTRATVEEDVVQMRVGVDEPEDIRPSPSRRMIRPTSSATRSKSERSCGGNNFQQSAASTSP